ncbi:metal ABC transporter ATP-binding protein [Candidatus Jorgensenbacteria bacterium]|nr:metal ABC transporter ATP-binding protein [Candidatus Jorgensenbacteria bacterium]
MSKINGQNLLKVTELSLVLEGQTILKDVSFEIKPEEVLAIIGPNGSGKSMLLKTIVGLVKQTSGTITWDPGTNIGYLPQRFQVDRYLPMTAKEFLNLKPAPLKSLDKITELVKIDKKFLNTNIAHLSGGELQRLLLAWSLIGTPNLLLFDEPTENVDVVGQESIYKLLHQLQDQMKIAIIIVSHDLHVVYRYANHVLCLNQRMICYGEPQATLTTKNLSEVYGDHAFFHHHHFNDTTENHA